MSGSAPNSEHAAVNPYPLSSRRDLFRLAGALGLLSLGGRAVAQEARGKRVLVIGGGIIGASIGYHLVRRGADVTIVEGNRPAGGATENSFAWLNAASKRPRPYYELNLLGILGWHRLQQQIAGLPVQWGGTVQWYDADGAAEWLRTNLQRQLEWGYAIQMVDAARVGELVPSITPGTVSAATFTEIEGTVNPALVTKAILDEAGRLGAAVEYPVQVTGFDVRDGRVAAVRTSAGAKETDVLVLAAGLGTTELAAQLGARIPLQSSPGLIAHTAPRPRVLERMAFGPAAYTKQNPDGSIVTARSFGGSYGVEATRENGEDLLRSASVFLPALRGVPLDSVTLGQRVLPMDGYPIVGFLESCPNAYVAAMHSGMTLGALIGQVAAAEILDGVQVDILETFRPNRFT